MHVVRSFVVFCFVVGIASQAHAQQGAAPVEQHKWLAKQAGEWDAEFGGDVAGAKGTAVFKMTLGGLWLESNFKGDFGGLQFEGRGFDTYDPAKKKFVSVWVDSMSTSPVVLEGELDKDGKKLTMEGSGPSPDGKTIKVKSVTEYKDDDTMLFTMSSNDQVMVKLTYKRKKAK